MMKRLFFLFALLINTTIGFAQNYDSDSVYYTPIPKPQPKLKKAVEEVDSPQKMIGYFFNVQMGTIIKDRTSIFATVHGVTIGEKLRAGLVLGYDSYQDWETASVAGVASWDLIGSKNKNAVFVQLAYGWASAGYLRHENYYNYPYSSVSGGRMVSPQIGYRIKYHKVKMSMTIGYKLQRVAYKQQVYYSYCFGCLMQTQSSYSETTRDVSRVQLIMSVGWK